MKKSLKRYWVIFTSKDERYHIVDDDGYQSKGYPERWLAVELCEVLNSPNLRKSTLIFGVGPFYDG